MVTLKRKGILSYIIPKSIAFSEGWKNTRNLIAEDNVLSIVIDTTKAFENVLLEQVIIVTIKDKQASYKMTVGDYWNESIKVHNEQIDNKFINAYDIIPIYVNSKSLNILKN
ncbi:MAG: hypothetical protein H7A23_19710 [Leptospiraceae bacterium]|nr:hypothetical protein [Leptospiraceae bacterium]